MGLSTTFSSLVTTHMTLDHDNTHAFIMEKKLIKYLGLTCYSDVLKSKQVLNWFFESKKIITTLISNSHTLLCYSNQFQGACCLA